MQMKDWSPSEVKAVFKRLFYYMQGVAKARNVSAVDLVPRDFESVLSAKYVYEVTDDMLQAAVAKAEAMQKAAKVACTTSDKGSKEQKRRLSDTRA